MFNYIATCGFKIGQDGDFKKISLEFREDNADKAKKTIDNFKKAAEKVGMDIVSYRLLEEK